jgi:hypothetical protein
VPKFSSRFKYDPRVQEIVLEDAPDSLRVAYLNSILEPLVYQHGSSNDDGRPLEVNKMPRQFCAIAREELPEFSSYTSVFDDLKTLVKGAPWFNFYDFVEHIGKALIEEQRHVQSSEWLSRFGFDTYRKNVNDLFDEDRIGWRLDESSELVREIPKPLSSRLERGSAMLTGNFAPARRHYLKALRYVSSHPLDPENAIKEITSAVESVGRVFYANAATLGDVVKEMRREGSWPTALIAMIEKFYVYASSEPAVRHGAPVSSSVVLADAEFSLHVGVAIIRYILEKHDSQKKIRR